MNQPPLIIPFQTEIYVTNNKNTPDKNCVRISPNYENVEYVSYLGEEWSLPPFPFSSHGKPESTCIFFCRRVFAVPYKCRSSRGNPIGNTPQCPTDGRLQDLCRPKREAYPTKFLWWRAITSA